MSDVLAGLFPPGVVVVAAAAADEDEARLFPEEAQWLGPMVPSRRREFTAGRNAARRALAALGVAPAAIGRHAGDRDPVWPEGIVGSISHASGVAVAVACARRSPQLRAIGLDLEAAGPLGEEATREVCLPAELAMVQALPAPAPSDWPTVIFSIKEAAYKAWFAVTRAPLEFHHMALALEAPARRFRATVAHAEAAALAGDGWRLEGRYAWDARCVAAGAVLTRA